MGKEGKAWKTETAFPYSSIFTPFCETSPRSQGKFWSELAGILPQLFSFFSFLFFFYLFSFSFSFSFHPTTPRSPPWSTPQRYIVIDAETFGKQYTTYIIMNRENHSIVCNTFCSTTRCLDILSSAPPPPKNNYTCYLSIGGVYDKETRGGGAQVVRNASCSVCLVYHVSTRVAQRLGRQIFGELSK